MHFRNYICSTSPFLTRQQAMFLQMEKEAPNPTKSTEINISLVPLTAAIFTSLGWQLHMVVQ